jgi:hypothetical protein
MSLEQQVALLLLPLAGVALIAVVLGVRSSRRRGREARALAGEWGGTLTREGSCWKIGFERNGIPHVLRLLPSSVQLSACPTSGALQPLEIGAGADPKTQPEGLRLPRGMGVKSHGDLDLKAFLTDRVVKNLDLLWRLDFEPGGSLVVEDACATLEKPSALAEGSTLRFFVNLALPVLDQVFKVCALEGVKFLDGAPPAAGLCQVCGCGLERGVVKCVECGTPHHLDCWNYAGKCTTYACGNRIARPA